MKHIALLIFQVMNNLGGIVSSVDQLKKGLEENGCDVDVIWAEWRDSTRKSFEPTRGNNIKRIPTDWGLILHVGSDSSARALGGPSISHAYKGEENAQNLRDKLSEYDGVICAASLPSSGSKKLRGNNDWMTVLKHGKPMVFVVRDCHWIRYNPHFVHVADLFQTAIGVHPAAFYSIMNMPVRVACVVNPFDISKAENPPERKEMDWVCSAAYFKAWKHMEDGLRAAPFLHPVHLFYMGGGIEKCYMIAKPKRREEYTGSNYDGYMHSIMQYWWSKKDKDFRPKFANKSVWTAAEDSGNFTFMGFQYGKKLDEIERLCGGIVDFSWHKEWGEHFNRVTIDGMIHRCVPFVRPLGISDNKQGKGEIIGPDNVVLIPESASPKRIADIIKTSLKDDRLVKEITSRNLDFIQKFDRKRVARQYLKLLSGERAGVLCEEGTPDKQSQKWIDFFNVKRRYPRLGIRFPRYE
jgi:glycosyltransferase involved in cell wall biosynthesis